MRSSGAGNFMTNSKEEKELPRGAKTSLAKWYYEQTTGERLFTGNKYTKKGWEVENDAIDDYAYYIGHFGDDLVKNEEFFENDFTMGTPDVLVGSNIVVDVKSPWELRTFAKYRDYSPTEERPAPNQTYFWQLQCYMWLTDRTEAELAYVLLNTPKHLLGRSDDWTDYEEEMTLEKRVKIFGITRSNDHICRIKKRVVLCREFLDKETIPNWDYWRTTIN